MILQVDMRKDVSYKIFGSSRGSVREERRIPRFLSGGGGGGGMPSVGTRRSTRVFVPKAVLKVSTLPRIPLLQEAAPAVKVLRSGKRLLPDSSAASEAWIRLLDNSNDVSESESEGKKKRLRISQDRLVEEVNDSSRNQWWKRHGRVSEALNAQKSGVHHYQVEDLQVADRDSSDNDAITSKRFGITYFRTRKRQPKEDRKYGLAIYERKRRKIQEDARIRYQIPVNCVREVQLLLNSVSIRRDEESNLQLDVWGRNFRGVVLACVVDSSSSSDSSVYFAKFLVSLLNYMGKGKPGFKLYRFVAFLCLEMISGVFSSHGVHFIPLLSSISLDINDAAKIQESCFSNDPLHAGGDLDWHSMMLIMLARNTVSYRLSLPKNNAGVCAVFGTSGCIPLLSLNFSAVPNLFVLFHSNLNLQNFLCWWRRCLSCLQNLEIVPSLDLPKELEACQSSNGLEDCEKLVGTRTSKSKGNRKKRRAIKSPRTISRQPLLDCSDSFINGIQSPSASLSIGKLAERRTHNKKIDTELELENVEAVSCQANILVTLTDTCQRLSGYEVKMQSSGPKDWFLYFSRNGTSRSHKPSHSNFYPNYVTHGMMYSDQGLKIDFSSYYDYKVFRKLVNECLARNVSTPVKSVPVKRIPFKIIPIPIPGVTEVEDYDAVDSVTFRMPERYISVHNEVYWTLHSDSVLYDVDSEDEEWLNGMNTKDEEIGFSEHVSMELFEKMIFEMEKAAFRDPDDISSMSILAALDSDLTAQDNLKLVYNYWIRKREKKGSAVMRVFQGSSLKNILPLGQVVERPVVRKPRTRKDRKPVRRGKPPLVNEEANPDDPEVQSVMGHAIRTRKTATKKRERAQLLSQNADLLIFKSKIALQIADAKQRDSFDMDALFIE